MARPKVKIPVRLTQYQALASFAGNVVATMTTNIALYPIPLPSLAGITGFQNTLQLAITAWGPVHARTTHANLLAVRSAAFTLYTALVSLAGYVQNIIDPTKSYADQAADIALSGYSVKNSPTPQGFLNTAENVHQVFASNVSLYFPKLAWKKPLGLNSPGNVKGWQISRSLQGAGPIIVIGTSTRCRFTDNTAVKGAQYYYYIAGINAAGISPNTVQLPVSIPL